MELKCIHTRYKDYHDGTEDALVTARNGANVFVRNYDLCRTNTAVVEVLLVISFYLFLSQSISYFLSILGCSSVIILD
jgi:hypothetical protein